MLDEDVELSACSQRPKYRMKAIIGACFAKRGREPRKLCRYPNREPAGTLAESHTQCRSDLRKKHTQYVQGAAPVFLQSGSGCRVVDVNGNTYLDYVQGLLPNILGYAHPEVNAAVTEQLSRGHSLSLPTRLRLN